MVVLRADREVGEKFSWVAGCLAGWLPAAVSVFSVSLDLVDDEEWVVCGSSHCRSCDNAWCEGEISGLGTDGKNQVQECPEDFYEIEFITVDRYWPFRDQYLRLCANFYYDDDEDYYYDEK